VPNLHVDPSSAVALATDADGWARLEDAALPVDCSCAPLAAANMGSYLVLLELAEAWEGEIGAL
jgi:hypothetical protein